MNFLRRILEVWTRIVRTTWQIFALFSAATVVAVYLHARRGDFEGTVLSDHLYDIGVGIILLFVASFVTALLVRYKAWRSSRWPGGGGPRRR